jgi:hypothetical protein
MIIAVQGSKTFQDYSIFMRAMRTALYEMDKEDKEIYIYSAGPVKTNNMALEFSNVSERGLKARGIKIQARKISSSWLEENMNSMDYFAFFSRPGEPISYLVDLADQLGVEAGVYTFQ